MLTHPAAAPTMSDTSKIARRQATILLDLIRRAEEANRQGQPADATLSHWYRAHREFGARDRRLFSETLFRWFRWRGWWLPADVANDTRLAAAIAVSFLMDADAAIPPAIQFLADSDALSSTPLRGLAGESLADKATTGGGWLGVNPPNAAGLAPGWATDLLHVPTESTVPEHRGRFLQSIQARPPTWLRTRTAYREEIRIAFESRGIPWRPHPVLPNACQAPERFALCQWPALHGKVEIQDVSSQVAGWIARPTPGSDWWDACAGAGGKTLHLADLRPGADRILATDIRAPALREAQRRFAAAGLRNVATATWDGHGDPAPGRQFDGVLLDAPCSGLGTWHRNPDARWRVLPATIPMLVGEQQRLLARAAAKVKPGGVLLYVTCTLTTLENTGVIATFCQSHPGFRPAPFVNPLNGQSTDGTLWLWPWVGPGNGMFTARLARANS